MGGFFDCSPDAPTPRNLGQETRDTLAAQTEYAPRLYEVESQYAPLYAGLATDVFARALLGSNGTRGLLDLYQNEIAPALDQTAADATRRQREADVSAVETLGPRASAAFRAANPQQQALLDELNQQTLANLRSGTGLDPSMRREAQQNVRAAQSARGFGYGPNDIFEEVLTLGSAGEALRQQRLATAMQVAGVNAATAQDPFLAILGRPSQTTPFAQSLVGQGLAAGENGGPRLFDPLNPYSADLYNTNYNAKAAAKIAAANNRAAIIAAPLSAL